MLTNRQNIRTWKQIESKRACRSVECRLVPYGPSLN